MGDLVCIDFYGRRVGAWVVDVDVVLLVGVMLKLLVCWVLVLLVCLWCLVLLVWWCCWLGCGGLGGLMLCD